MAGVQPEVLYQNPSVQIVRSQTVKTGIPYGPNRHPEGVNFGYVDLKRNPQMIGQIMEVRQWPELLGPLMALNGPGGLASFGCAAELLEDRGQWEVISYFHIGFADFGRNSQMVIEELSARLAEPLAMTWLECRARWSFQVEPFRYYGRQAWGLDLSNQSLGGDRRVARAVFGYSMERLSTAIDAVKG